MVSLWSDTMTTYLNKVAADQSDYASSWDAWEQEDSSSDSQAVFQDDESWPEPDNSAWEEGGFAKWGEGVSAFLDISFPMFRTTCTVKWGTILPAMQA